MTPFHLVAFVSLFSFLATFAVAPLPCMAKSPLVRAAATKTDGSVAQYRSASQETHKRTRLGFEPVPFSPSRAVQKHEKAPPPQNSPISGHIGLPDVRQLVKNVNRSVVSIRMLDSSASWSLGKLRISDGGSHDKAMGYGSGFIVSPRGHVLTNEHVLRNGSIIEIELLGGRKYEAKALYKDSKNDLALLKIDPDEPVEPVKLGDSDIVELGEWVIGIGNPYGIGQSLMMGIVSAKKRLIPGSGYPPLIQIDAAMNLGNSGGPLFNMEGEVVGVNTILLWKSQGIGFATPINVARRFLVAAGMGRIKSASAPGGGPMGPIPDGPRSVEGSFNPLAPPWSNQH